jgi:hypothetical protein
MHTRATINAWLLCTAKSCGPGAAVLASSFLRSEASQERRWQESRSPGSAKCRESRKSCLRFEKSSKGAFRDGVTQLAARIRVTM